MSRSAHVSFESPKRRKQSNEPQGVTYNVKNNTLTITGVPNDKVGIAFVKHHIRQPSTRYINVDPHVFSDPFELRDMGFMTFDPTNQQKGPIDKFTLLMLNDMKQRRERFRYNTQHIDRGQIEAIRRLPFPLANKAAMWAKPFGNKGNGPILLKNAVLDHDANALRIFTGQPKNYAAMSPGSRAAYVTRHVRHTRDNPYRRGYTLNKMGMNKKTGSKVPFERFATNSKLKSTSIYFKNGVFSPRTRDAVARGLATGYDVVDVNGSVSYPAGHRARVRREKLDHGFSSANSQVPAAAAEIAFASGKPLGGGGFGETRTHTLANGTRVVIKRFKVKKAKGVYTMGGSPRESRRVAAVEQAGHEKAWRREELRPFMTRPVQVKRGHNQGANGYTIQLLAAYPGETVITAADFFGYGNRNNRAFRSIRNHYHATRDEVAKQFVKDVLDFIHKLQKYHLRHNDLNLRNILMRFSERNEYLGIVVIDWGLALLNKKDNLMNSLATEDVWTGKAQPSIERLTQLQQEVMNVVSQYATPPASFGVKKSN